MDEGPQIKMVSMVNKMDNIYNVQVSGKAMVGVGSACLRRAKKHRALAPAKNGISLSLLAQSCHSAH